MSYSVEVPCTCYRDGKATPPPFAVFWNEYEGYFEAEDPIAWDSPGWEDQELALNEWSECRCDHPAGLLAGGWLANTSGMASLRLQVSELYLDELRRSLPTSNDGYLEAAQCAKLLPELEVLRDSSEWATRLVRMDTGQRVTDRVEPGYVRSSDFGWVILTRGQLALRTDPRDEDKFAATTFVIRCDRPGGAEKLIDLDRHFQFSGRFTIPDDWPRNVVLRTHLLERQSQFFNDAAELLISCCRAAVENNTRLYWR